MAYAVTVAFIAGDFCTGFMQAWKNHEVESSVMREGLFHKAALLFLLLLSAGVNYAVKYIDLGVMSDVPIGYAFCVYISLMEIGSIIENLGKLNPEIVPDKIKKYFTKLN